MAEIQRYWKIRHLNDHYAMTTCLVDGGSEWREGNWHPTRELAEDDAIASGLPSWPGATPGDANAQRG